MSMASSVKGSQPCHNMCFEHNSGEGRRQTYFMWREENLQMGFKFYVQLVENDRRRDALKLMSQHLNLKAHWGLQMRTCALQKLIPGLGQLNISLHGK